MRAHLKAVLFDMDGTIINTIDDLSDATNHALSIAGYPLHTPEEYKMMVGNGIPKLIERAVPCDARTPETLAKVYDDFMAYYRVHSMDKTRPYTGVPELVNRLRNAGLKTAVVTNKVETAARSIAESMYPNGFDLVIGQRPDLPPKPDPAAAKLAMQTLGVTPDECVFIGDSGVDIQTAANSGALAIGVLWGFRGEEELRANGAKVIVKSPDELWRFLSSGTPAE